MNGLTKQPFHVPTLAIIGVGLIGGSLSLALKQRGLVSHVIAVGRSEANLQKALALKAIDEICQSVAEATERADIIVVATPVGTMGAILREIYQTLDHTKIVTDVGSVKHGVVEQASSILDDKISRFVPAHPIAGKEHSGVEAASGDLFVRHKVAITATEVTDRDASLMVQKMWRSVGAQVVEMEVDEHDRVLAMTSHLPHVLAYAMVHYFAESEDREKCYEMAAGGFYDFTRIASSDPVMWRDICRMNKQQVLEHIKGFQNKLDGISQLLQNGNDEQIETLFSSAKEARAKVTEKRKSSLDSDAEREGKRRVQQMVNR